MKKNTLYFVILFSSFRVHAAQEVIVVPEEIHSSNERILEAECYLDGCGVERDLKRARTLFQDIAWSNVDDTAKAHAYLHIALMHFYGISLPPNNKIATIFLKKACSYQTDSAITKVCEYWKKQFIRAREHPDLIELPVSKAGEIYAGLRYAADSLYHHFSGKDMATFRASQSALKERYKATYVAARSITK